jgi:hypothetical protein
MRVLSIDGWRDNEGWTWNQWFEVGTLDKEEFETLTTNRKVLKWFRDNNYLSNFSKGKMSIDDDGYNLVVQNKDTFEPLFAIEYGPEY